jgi:hypothetical protein
LPPTAAFHQWLLRQVVQLIDGIPGGFVTQAGAFCGAVIEALFGNVLQQGDALRTADDVLGEQGGQGHGWGLFHGGGGEIGGNAGVKPDI